MIDFKDTFNKLSQIDVNEHTEKKGQFTYLSWTWAWKTLVENTETASYVWNDDKTFADGTMEVSCNLTVNGHTLPMWGAVTNHINVSIENPDSHSINTARMRCLVKAMAMFGLGHYIYAGESLPEDVDKTNSNGTQLPADSYASPEPNSARNVESQNIEKPKAEPLDINKLLKEIPKVGYALKDKKTYKDCLPSLQKDIDWWGSKNSPTEDQKEHLINLRAIKTAQIKSNQGVI